MGVLLPWLKKPSAFYDSRYVLDTNILLSLYRVLPESRTQLLSILNAAKEHLWMPGQIAREYNKNRAPVIIEFSSIHRDLIDRIYSKVSEATTSLQQTPYAAAASKIAKDALAGVKGALEAFGKKYECTEGNDPVLRTLEQVYDNRVGEHYEEKELHQKITNAKARIAKGMPPGLIDAKEKIKDAANKEDPASLNIANVYGDVIVWYQIIDYCTARKSQYLTFVTEDNKEDDWWRIQSGRFSVGPRIELQEELHKLTGTTFHIMSQRTFFNLCSQAYHFEIQSAIDEFTAASRSRNAPIDAVIESVPKQLNWLRRDVFKLMESACHIRDYNRLYGKNRESIADEVESQYMPLLLQRGQLDWRLQALQRAIVVYENASDSEAIPRSHNMLRDCVFDYFGCNAADDPIPSGPTRIHFA